MLPDKPLDVQSLVYQVELPGEKGRDHCRYTLVIGIQKNRVGFLFSDTHEVLCIILIWEEKATSCQVQAVKKRDQKYYVHFLLRFLFPAINNNKNDRRL